MPPRRLVPGELGATDRAAAVGIGSLSAARFFDFLGCGPRPEGDGVNGANLQGPAVIKVMPTRRNNFTPVFSRAQLVWAR